MGRKEQMVTSAIMLLVRLLCWIISVLSAMFACLSGT